MTFTDRSEDPQNIIITGTLYCDARCTELPAVVVEPEHTESKLSGTFAFAACQVHYVPAHDMSSALSTASRYCTVPGEARDYFL